MVKIKVSYERPEELRRLLEKLRPEVKNWKESQNREGDIRTFFERWGGPNLFEVRCVRSLDDIRF